MSGAFYQYYACEDQSVNVDILRAAINSDAESYTLDVYSKGADGKLSCYSSGRDTAAKARGANRSNAASGLAAAVGAVLGTVLFLPILYSTGQLPFMALVFLTALIGAWAGGAFAFSLPSLMRRKLKQLRAGELVIVCYAEPHTQDVIRQTLARYSKVLPDPAPTAAPLAANESVERDRA